MLRHLLAEARLEAPPDGGVERVPPAPVARQDPAYRPCPGCGQLMHRVNYGRRSGVIVDSCARHGVWFDAEELARILAWVRSGGERQAADRRRDELRHRETVKRFESHWPEAVSPAGRGSTLIDLLRGLAASILG